MSNNLKNIQKLVDDGDAQRKYDDFKSKDPYPSIQPALLNSADIHDYIIATGMVCPYKPEKKLKSASYEITFSEGEIVYWEDNKKQIYNYLNEDDEFELKKNSIVFVRIKTQFRLPNYIALRFNLRINLVHKGLLLGTGPLVDPGFVGNLLVPVHNLTANDYKIRGTEGFIWVEFTKISNNSRWSNASALKQDGEYIPFPQSKINLSAENYFESANNNNPIQSSIPGEVKEAKEAAANSINIATKTKKHVDDLVDKAKKYSLVAVVIAAISVIWPIYSLISDAISYVNNAKSDLSSQLKELQETKKDLQSQKKELNGLAVELRTLLNEQKALKEKKDKKYEKKTGQLKDDKDIK